MSVVEDEIEESGLALVHLRNNFYRKKLRQVLGIYFLNLGVIAILISIIFYLLKNPTEPFYFPASKAGVLIREVPLQQTDMTMDEIIAWTVSAVQDAYSYDYVNYRQQLQNAQKYFTEYGWRNYMQGLQTSNNLLSLNQYKYVVTARVVGQPKLLTQGLLQGAAILHFE